MKVFSAIVSSKRGRSLLHHSPIPRNPLIATACFKAGYIDARGRGIEKMTRACAEAGLPPPTFEANSGGVLATFSHPQKATPHVTPEVTPEVAPEVIKMLGLLRGAMTRGEVMSILGLRDEKHFREHYQQVASNSGLIEMTIPEKPKSPLQKYRLTAKGCALLEKSNHTT
jgi:ATP-dependent DNA helicase RecG